MTRNNGMIWLEMISIRTAGIIETGKVFEICRRMFQSMINREAVKILGSQDVMSSSCWQDILNVSGHEKMVISKCRYARWQGMVRLQSEACQGASTDAFRPSSSRFPFIATLLLRNCYEALIPRMVRGATLVADNAVSHGYFLQEFLQRAMGERRVDALIVPIGNGALLCRKI
jgi:hypothetical protein